MRPGWFLALLAATCSPPAHADDAHDAALARWQARMAEAKVLVSEAGTHRDAADAARQAGDTATACREEQGYLAVYERLLAATRDLAAISREGNLLPEAQMQAAVDARLASIAVTRQWLDGHCRSDTAADLQAELQGQAQRIDALLRKGRSSLRAAIKEQQTGDSYAGAGDAGGGAAGAIFSAGLKYFAACQDARDARRDFDAALAAMREAQARAAAAGLTVTDLAERQKAAQDGRNVAETVVAHSCR